MFSEDPRNSRHRPNPPASFTVCASTVLSFAVSSPLQYHRGSTPPKNCTWLECRGAYFRASEVRYFPLYLSQLKFGAEKAGSAHVRQRERNKMASHTREAASAGQLRLPLASAFFLKLLFKVPFLTGGGCWFGPLAVRRYLLWQKEAYATSCLVKAAMRQSL